MQEVELLENKELRDKLISRLDVLEKVKQLVLIPETEYATVEQVAEYYEIDKKSVENVINRHIEELISDGYKHFTRKEVLSLLNIQNECLETVKGKTNVIITGQVFSIPNRGLRLFPRRAILRVGMLLRDSEIAKRIRTYLLDTEEAVPSETKLATISEEEKILLKAIKSNTKEELVIALNEYYNYTNRRINVLQDKVIALADGILKWDARSAVNKIVRRIALKLFGADFGLAWKAIYIEMLYKHHINVNARIKFKEKHSTIFDVLNEDELKLLIKSCVAICEENEIDITDIICKMNYEAI